MPWKEIKIMDQREYFVGDYLTGDYPKGALCKLYGISRPTGDKWLARYHAQGVVGLADMARRPHTQPHQTPEAVVEAILAMKHRHPSFGPKKIRDRLRAVVPEEAWPVDSTVGVILKWAGLVRPRRHGVRTSRGIFRWARGSAVIRSPSWITRAGICCGVRGWCSPRPRWCSRGWRGCFTSMGCRPRCGRTPARPLRRRRWGGEPVGGVVGAGRHSARTDSAGHAE